MAFISLDDTVLHYEVYGRGTPLILLHGNGEDMEYFHHQIPIFSLEYRVICLDSRGHGRSGRGVKPLSFDTFCEDLAAFMDLLHIKEAILLGFSDGANTALLFALTHPQKVVSLILSSPNLDPSGLLFSLRLQICGMYGWCRVLSLGKKWKKKKELLELMWKQPSIKVEMLSFVSHDVLLIVGENDMITAAHTDKIAKALPHCIVKIISGGDHFIAVKKPDIFNQEVMRFLYRCLDEKKRHL
ncbi:MAG: alpha/beta hydrolase [Erysipelotrichaceae bacterium]|nr:alpha/beta hydrolase [Erysipelotrichaceae bacterium]